MRWLLTIIGKCSHGKLSFPLTLNKQTYVTCLECGKEFTYDWQQMRVAEEIHG